MPDALRRLPAAAGQGKQRSGAVLAVRPDLHRENFIVRLAHSGCRSVGRGAGRRIRARGAWIFRDRDSWDFGVGAGFYVDATVAPWAAHYRMHSYVSHELPALVAANFPVDASRAGIFGHSMGGHGALTIALKHPECFRSVSAFAPIASSMRCPWGEKALGNYLGDIVASWRDHDAPALRGSWVAGTRILVDQERTTASSTSS